MQVEIYTTTKELINNEIKKVILPSQDGEITILNDHAPILGTLTNGEIKLMQENNNIIGINVNEGFFNFKDNNLLIIITHTQLNNEELEQIKQNAIKSAENKITKENISEKHFKELKESTNF